MKDPRLNALVVLVGDWLPSLGVDERRRFMRELRCGWCERCGHTESAMCGNGVCEAHYQLNSTIGANHE